MQQRSGFDLTLGHAHGTHVSLLNPVRRLFYTKPGKGFVPASSSGFAFFGGE
jgi:hypothetical protein